MASWITLEIQKYGMTKDQLFEAFKILKSKGAKYFGIHAFLKATRLQMSIIHSLLSDFSSLLSNLKTRQDVTSDSVNLSGGVGVAYKPDQTPNDIKVIGEGVHKVYDEVLVPAGMGDVSIYTEMGRFMLAPYGCVIVTKAIHEKHIYKEYIGVDANVSANLMRPAIYGSISSYYRTLEKKMPHATMCMMLWVHFVKTVTNSP